MKNWSDSEDDDGDVSALAQDKTRSNPGKAAARKEGAATEAILPPVNLRPPPPPSPPKRVDSPSDSNEKEEAETMRSQQTKKQKPHRRPHRRVMKELTPMWEEHLFRRPDHGRIM